MAPKSVLIRRFVILSIVLFCPDFIMAQMDVIYRFKNVNIPVSLKTKDQILGKGAYDLEFCRSANPETFFVRIMKRGKILDLVQGEEFPYGVAEDRDIPYKPTLKMNKNQSDKLLILAFESGIGAKFCPKTRARFKIPYEE
jgi:hypothetical protein